MLEQSESPCDLEPAPCPAVETIVVPRERDLGGGLVVSRALPSPLKQMVGPFIFLDRMGPVEFGAGRAEDVRPHPHIGLSTLTYLFEGSMVHRDSLGTEMVIRPGAVNLMTAGRGIVHSERHEGAVKRSGGALFGLQSWLALPAPLEETAPAFEHTPADAIPQIDQAQWIARVVAGSAYGANSPVRTAWPTLYVEVRQNAGAIVPIDVDYTDRALFLLSGRIELEGAPLEPGRLVGLRPGRPAAVKALEPAHWVVLGGEPLDGPRYIYWNFVSSSEDRIAQAKDDWRQGRFALVPGDDTEFIPLPHEGTARPLAQLPREHPYAGERVS